MAAHRAMPKAIATHNRTWDKVLACLLVAPAVVIFALCAAWIIIKVL